MSLTTKKREQVFNYITELVGRGEERIAKKVSETFGLSPTTTYHNLRKLRDDGIIEKEGESID
ncbi:MAG: helix-turn-helix domain-containing protein [Planctomycetia bacterium]|nr:helix-turn-helix domain-containing protein [Planctomycetia bacterium]